MRDKPRTKVIEKDTRVAKQPPIGAEVIRPDPPGKRLIRKDDKMNVDRLKEIIQLACKLEWVELGASSSGKYPLMQLSEVEKCMVAMYDDFELGRMRHWVNENQSSNQTARKNDE